MSSFVDKKPFIPVQEVDITPIPPLIFIVIDPFSSEKQTLSTTETESKERIEGSSTKKKKVSLHPLLSINSKLIESEHKLEITESD